MSAMIDTRATALSKTGFTPEEIEDKVAGVVAGHLMAGFQVPQEEREVLRQIIAGEIDGEESIAQLVEKFKRENAAAAKRAG